MCDITIRIFLSNATMDPTIARAQAFKARGVYGSLPPPLLSLWEEIDQIDEGIKLLKTG